MSTKLANQANCQADDPAEKAKCQNICTRDTSGNPLTGCPLTEQCMEGYCASCSASYDPLTCWDKANLKFYDENIYKISTVTESCQVADSEAYSIYNLALRVGASDCRSGKFYTPGKATDNKPYTNDGAFVYQYVSRDNGQSCSFINRFEYTETDLCQPGFCYYDNNDNNPNNDCYQPGSCLAGCSSTGENCGYCSNSQLKTQADCTSPSVWTSKDQFKNLYCYLGSWRQSCGDGFFQPQCGESCDPNMPMTASSSWCDRLFGPQDWYNEASIKASCTASCTISEGGNLTIEDCGGFCGDKVIEPESNEQCDEGLASAPLQPGRGGLGQDTQYMCSGKGGGNVPVIDGSACKNYSNYDTETASLSCSSDLLSSTSRVFKRPDSSLHAEGGFRASYEFTLTQSGGYNLQITAANFSDDLTKLTNSQIDYLISQKQPGDNLFNITGVCRNSNVTSDCNDDNVCKNVNYPNGSCEKGAVRIPEYGLIEPTDNRKYDLLKSLIFSVYLDNDSDPSANPANPGNFVGFIIMPGSNVKQTGNLYIGGLTAELHTIYLHFVGDHYYYYLSDDPPGSAAKNPLAEVAAGLPDPLALDVNPLIYSISMYSPQAAVGDCKSYGGWCGDGQVEMQYGEQCDVKNYLPPSTEQTVNIVFNPGFEGYFTPWQKVNSTVNLDNDQYFEGKSSVKMAGDLAGAEVNLQQLKNFLPGKKYTISLRIKGEVDKVEFQVGNLSQSKSWLASYKVEMSENTAEKKADWKLYQVTNFTSPVLEYGIGEEFQFIFTPATGTKININIDDIKIVAEASARPQYQCASDLVSGALCQYKGGYCGDGKIQSNFGENCDDRVGLSCTSISDCGKTGDCKNNICESVSCNNICKSTYCGDGITQRPNSSGTYEICDYKDDPQCASDCTHVKMGADCITDTYGQ
ncbi:MAG: carbohydrate binding domain-containing protein, partial [Candidatus Parcubacteria bacterium]|nr:carbohydrate binding domain-containing protein [Candidatus Parcubacteria bacterium]